MKKLSWNDFVHYSLWYDLIQHALKGRAVKFLPTDRAKQNRTTLFLNQYMALYIKSLIFSKVKLMERRFSLFAMFLFCDSDNSTSFSWR